MSAASLISGAMPEVDGGAVILHGGIPDTTVTLLKPPVATGGYGGVVLKWPGNRLAGRSAVPDPAYCGCVIPATDGGTAPAEIVAPASGPTGTGTGAVPDVGGKVGGAVAPMGGGPADQVRLNFAPVPAPLVETWATGFGGMVLMSALPAAWIVTEATLVVVSVVTLTMTPLPRVIVSLRA